jgi:hypothetical protein
MSGAQVYAHLLERGVTMRTIVLSGMRGRAFDAAVRSIAPVAALRKPLEPRHLTKALADLRM